MRKLTLDDIRDFSAEKIAENLKRCDPEFVGVLGVIMAQEVLAPSLVDPIAENMAGAIEIWGNDYVSKLGES